MPFGPVKNITPISVFGTVPLVLVVNTSVAAKNTRELVALVKASPGKLNYGSAGNGSVLHLAGELYKEQAGAFHHAHTLPQHRSAHDRPHGWPG